MECTLELETEHSAFRSIWAVVNILVHVSSNLGQKHTKARNPVVRKVKFMYVRKKRHGRQQTYREIVQKARSD